MKYKNYKNPYTKEDKIYSRENMLDMSLREMMSRKDELLAQTKVLGIPEDNELKTSVNAVYVEAYTREDGTEVKAHWRSKPDTDSITGSAIGTDSIANNGIEQYLDLFSTSLYALKYFMNNGLVDSDNMNLWEEFQGFVYEQIPGRLYSNSSKLLRDAMHNFSEAKNNKNATVENGIHSLDKNVQNEIKKLGCPDNSQGVIYNENSEMSKLFSNSPNLKKIVKNPNNLKDIIDNKYQNGISFEFGKKNLLLKNEYDRYSSLQHAKIINPKIKNGYMIGTIVDYYDFSKRPNTVQNIPNNWGYDQQQKGILNNYYICVKIERYLFSRIDI